MIKVISIVGGVVAGWHLLIPFCQIMDFMYAALQVPVPTISPWFFIGVLIVCSVISMLTIHSILKLVIR